MPSCLQAVLFSAALCCAPKVETFQAGAVDADSTVTIFPRVRTQPARTAPLLRIDSSMVLIPVHVTNALGASVDGLVRDSFHVLEDRVEQTIASFLTEEAPVSVGLLFDTSGSMRSKMKKATEAAAAFFRTANPEDEFFLVEFNDRPRLIVPFTRNSDEIYEEIARTRPAGRTTLIDAVYLSLNQMKRARHPRKVIVILSDGGDNWSRHSARELRTTLLESDVQVYAMGIFDSTKRTHEEKTGPQLLDELTSETGGRHFIVDNLETLPEISERVGRELRSQYVLGYYSTNRARDGKYRHVSLKLTTPNARELHTDYRRGYYAPLD